MNKPSFSDWPEESVAKLTAIFRQVIREELAATRMPTPATHDAKFLASLSKSEYDELIRRQAQ